MVECKWFIMDMATGVVLASQAGYTTHFAALTVLQTVYFIRKYGSDTDIISKDITQGEQVLTFKEDAPKFSKIIS